VGCNLYNAYKVKVKRDEKPISKSDEPPTRDATPMGMRGDLTKLLLSSINEKQVIILSRLYYNRNEGITSVLRSLSISEEIPLSTLKLNARKLREFGLIAFSGGGSLRPATLTKSGSTILSIINKVNAEP
jgi:hypothetical protein